MPQHFRTKIWQLVLPDEWRASSGRSGDELVSFWNPGGVGILTVLVSAETKAPPRSGNQRAFSGKLKGQTFEFLGGDAFARHWTLLCGSQWIHVYYSCAAKNVEVERRDVDEILQSISEAT